MLKSFYFISQFNNFQLLQLLNSNHVHITFSQLTPTAVKDYNRARDYLCDIANRDGFPVFTDIAEATEFAINRVKSK